MKNYKYFLFIVLALSACYSASAAMYLYNFPYWIGVNETGTVYVTNYDDETDNYAEMSINGGNASNMTFISNKNLFRAYVTSASEEDDNFTIVMYTANGTVIANGTSELRFRIPFYSTFSFYKNDNLSDTDVEKYENEFQYALLHYRPDGTDTVSYTLDSVYSTSILDAIGSLFPYYNSISGSRVEVDSEIYLWARLEDGDAEVKMYENGTYDVYTMNTGFYGVPLYEFGLPINNDESRLRTKFVKGLAVEEETDASYTVFISAWEVYKWNMTKNILKIIGVLLVWGFVAIFLGWLTTCWIPNKEIAAKGFGVVLGVIAIATSPLVIMAIRAVWT